MKQVYLLVGLGVLAQAPLVARAQQNVGIGTSSPNAKAALDISATDKGLLIPRLTQAQRTAISSPPDGLMVFQTDGTTGFWYYFGGAWVNIPNASTAGDNLGNHTATRNLNLGANQLVGNGGTAGLSITNGGNVGVGTTTPVSRLDVAGRTTTAQLGFSTNDADKIYLTQAQPGSRIAHSAGWSVDYYAGPGAGGAAGQHRFFTSGPSWQERVRIANNGFVGIGSTNPATPLHVKRTGAYSTATLESDNVGPHLSFVRTGEAAAGLIDYIGTTAGAGLRGGSLEIRGVNNVALYGRGDVSAPDLLVNANGNVGIGLRDPNTRLHVSGDATITGQVYMGLVTLTQDYSINGNTWSGYSISCPGGTRLIGGGGGHRDNNSAQTSIRVNYSGPRPNLPDQVWQLNVENTSSSSRAIRIYCICARMQ